MNSINAQIKDAVEQDDRESISKLKRLQNEMRNNQRSALATQIMGMNSIVYSMYKNYPPKKNDRFLWKRKSSRLIYAEHRSKIRLQMLTISSGSLVSPIVI